MEGGREGVGGVEEKVVLDLEVFQGNERDREGFLYASLKTNFSNL